MKPGSLLSLLSLSLLTLAPIASSQDPAPPPGGFIISSIKDTVITWSDGYRSTMDIYYPKRAAPRTGWPVVAVIHGKNQSKNAVRGMARHLASRGYATFAYDWRGQGSTDRLNKAWTGTYTWNRIITDAAESYGISSKLAPGRMDSKRLAMTGSSGGAAHCWDAAANSGRPLKVKGTVANYPRILAIAPEINPPETFAMNLPWDGLIMRTRFAEDLSKQRTGPLWKLALAGKYDQIASLIKANGGGSRFSKIKSNDVAVFCRMGWDDYLMWVSQSLDYLDQLKPGVPYKGLVTGKGHGTPAKNVIEKDSWRDQAARWFDYFMKGAKNRITKEPLFEAAVTPLDSRYSMASSQWQHRYSPVWPPKTPVQRSYLRADMSLSPQAPTTAEGGPALKHRVAAGYNLKTFIDRDKAGDTKVKVGRVMGSIPFISHAFVGAVLQDEVELFGRPHVEFSIQSSTGDFQISAALLVRNAANQERYIVGGTTALRGKKAGIHKLSFALRDVATIVPKGVRLVLRIENLPYIRTPTQHVIEYLPWFWDVDLQMQISPAAPAVLDLPVATRGVGLTPRYKEVSAAGGINQAIHLDLGPAQSSRLYLLYISASGFGPGTPLGSVLIPLNIDPWTMLGISLANTPVFASFAGLTDAQGQATARFRLPASAAKTILGTRLTTAALVFPTQGGWAAGGPSQIVIIP